MNIQIYLLCQEGNIFQAFLPTTFMTSSMQDQAVYCRDMPDVTFLRDPGTMKCSAQHSCRRLAALFHVKPDSFLNVTPRSKSAQKHIPVSSVNSVNNISDSHSKFDCNSTVEYLSNTIAGNKKGNVITSADTVPYHEVSRSHKVGEESWDKLNTIKRKNGRRGTTTWAVLKYCVGRKSITWVHVIVITIENKMNWVLGIVWWVFLL